MRYRYGDSWERFPIEEGEIWSEPTTGALISVCDLLKSLPDYMQRADMIYCDPPWNLGNTNSFYTKAGLPAAMQQFNVFSEGFFDRISGIVPEVCYVEIGRQHADLFEAAMHRLFPVVQKWNITYYKKYPCILIRGGYTDQPFDFAGLDDAQTPSIAIAHETAAVVGDLCAGRGLTTVAAYQYGKTFVGIELNKRRLAVAIDRVAKLGGRYEKSAIS